MILNRSSPSAHTSTLPAPSQSTGTAAEVPLSHGSGARSGITALSRPRLGWRREHGTCISYATAARRHLLSGPRRGTVEGAKRSGPAHPPPQSHFRGAAHPTPRYASGVRCAGLASADLTRDGPSGARAPVRPGARCSTQSHEWLSRGSRGFGGKKLHPECDVNGNLTIQLRLRIRLHARTLTGSHSEAPASVSGAGAFAAQVSACRR
jgi:hypothetical protein